MEDSTPTTRRTLRLSKRTVIGIIAGLVMVLLIGGGVAVAADSVRDARSGGEIENIAPGAIGVTDQQARDTVLAAFPGATIESVDLDGEGGGDLMYDVSLSTGEEIRVNARTGALAGAETDDADGADEDGD